MLKVSDISNDDYTNTATNQQQTLQKWLPKHVPVALLARRMAVASIVVHMHIDLTELWIGDRPLAAPLPELGILQTYQHARADGVSQDQHRLWRQACKLHAVPGKGGRGAR